MKKKNRLGQAEESLVIQKQDENLGNSPSKISLGSALSFKVSKFESLGFRVCRQVSV
jgi:hypothetical protein